MQLIIGLVFQICRIFRNFTIEKRENSLYDKKSLSAIHGQKANFKKIVKDCVGFADAHGGMIDFEIEDNEELPYADQRMPGDLSVKLLNEIAGKTVNASAYAEVIAAYNGGKFLRPSIHRNAHSLASKSDGRYYLRVGDSSKPLLGDEFFRLAGEKDSTKWENIRSHYDWQKSDKDKLSDLLLR